MTMHLSEQFFKLIGVAAFLEQQESLDDCLDELSDSAAGLLNVRNCSIMLFRQNEESGEFRLRICAVHGELTPDARSEGVKLNEGIVGRVAASGQAVLVEDILSSEFSSLARRPDSPSRGFICVPILITDRVIGVINVSNPVDGRRFDQSDLNLANLFALLVGKSLQVSQLQNLLRSRYAQLALMKETQELTTGNQLSGKGDTELMVKVFAKTFYREMTRAGFGRDHIVEAATEIISLLSDSLQRYNQRYQRSRPDEA
jgi:signal transduction protein with GAF and PtsI domain